MEGMYSTATEQWKGEWFSPSNPTIRSRFTYKSTAWVTDKLPCKICNVVDEVDAFYCDMCDEAYHHHCIGWPRDKKEPKQWFCSEFGRNCQKVIDTWGPMPTSKIYKGSFKMKGRVDRVQESFVLKFRYLPSLASTSVDSPSICADAFGYGTNTYGKFIIRGKLEVYNNFKALPLKNYIQFHPSNGDERYLSNCARAKCICLKIQVWSSNGKMLPSTSLM